MKGIVLLYDEAGIQIKRLAYWEFSHRKKIIEMWRTTHGPGFQYFSIGIIPNTKPDNVRIDGTNFCSGSNKKIC